MARWKEDGVITRFTLLRSTSKKGRGMMEKYLETSSTTVSWNLRNVFWGNYEISTMGSLKTRQTFGW